MKVAIVTMEGYEADDLLGTIAGMAEKKGIDATILSGDRDLLQLATDHVLIRIPKTKGGKTQIEDYRGKKVNQQAKARVINYNFKREDQCLFTKKDEDFNSISNNRLRNKEHKADALALGADEGRDKLR